MTETRPPETRTEKRCFGFCREIKPMVAFSKKKRGDYENYCKPCNAKRSKAWRLRNPKKHAEYARQWATDKRELKNEIARRHYHNLTPDRMARRVQKNKDRYKRLRQYLPSNVVNYRPRKQATGPWARMRTEKVAATAAHVLSLRSPLS